MVEAMQHSSWWDVTKLKTETHSHINTDECLICPPAYTEGESQDQTQPRDIEVQQQDRTEFQDGENTSNWLITKEELPASCRDHNGMLSDLTEVPRATCGDFVMRLEMDEPGQKVQEKAEKELRETKEIMEKSIPELQGFLREEEENKGLIVPVNNVAWLKRFLRPTHYYPVSAFEKVQNYYKFKIQHKKFYEGLKPSNEKNFFENNIMTVLPKRDKEGRRLLVVRIGEVWDYEKCSLDEIYKGAVVALESAMLEPETQISGAVLIFDMKGLSFWQIWHFTMHNSFVFRVVQLLQNASPLRVKGLHVVNQPSAFGILLKLFTNLMDTKFKDRIEIHGSARERLLECIGSDNLPPEYGGACTIPLMSGLTWYQGMSMLDKEYEAVNSFGYKDRKK